MSDLTAKEQANARVAIRFLKARAGAWAPLGKALHIDRKTLGKIGRGTLAVSASIAVRVARFAGVGVDEVLLGRFPPAGACPHCGHVAQAEI